MPAIPESDARARLGEIPGWDVGEKSLVRKLALPSFPDAIAFIVKTVNPVDLASALRQALEGNVYHAHGVRESDDGSVARSAGLTEREISMLKALARGLSNQAISREFWVTEPTVKFHLTNIYRKLGVANRTEAARQAYSLGLVER
jgi:DNA-binding NarL/FixJ family response regulator